MALTDNQPKERFSRLHYFFFLIRRNPLMILGLLIILTFLIVTVTAPLLASHDPIKINPRDRLTAPNLKHLFGTDEMGRDIFSRIVYGTRITLQLGLTVIIAALLMGSFLGILAGFFGGFIDELIMRLTDIFMSFPYLVLTMVLTVIKELLYNETKTVDIVTIGLRDRERSLVLNIKYGGWAIVCDFSSISSSSLSALVRRSSNRSRRT
jgi:ABC-type dipeptide/oligopeptide/nickel transport system permease subunit